MKNLLLVLVALLFTQASFAESTICYGKKRGFAVKAPDTWTVDSKGGKEKGVCAFFYQAGSTFENAAAVFYPSQMENPRGEEADLKKFIKDDIANFQKDAPKMKVSNSKLPASLKKMGFQGRIILDGASPNEFEEILYLKKAESILIVVSDARKKENLEKYRPVFYKMAATVTEVPIKKP